VKHYGFSVQLDLETCLLPDLPGRALRERLSGFESSARRDPFSIPVAAFLFFTVLDKKQSSSPVKHECADGYYHLIPEILKAHALISAVTVRRSLIHNATWSGRTTRVCPSPCLASLSLTEEIACCVETTMTSKPASRFFFTFSTISLLPISTSTATLSLTNMSVRLTSASSCSVTILQPCLC